MVAKNQRFEGVEVLHLMNDDERRSYKRAYVVVSGQVSDQAEDELKLDCVILNLSASGAKVRFDDPIVSDQIKKITLAGTVDFDVELAWVDGVFAGLKFLDTPENVARVLASILPESCLEF